MNKDSCFYLGVITRIQGIKGNVSVFLDVDSPKDYNRMESVFVEINNNLVPFFIEHLQVRNRNQAIIKFEGIDSTNDAERLINKPLWLPLQALPQLSGNKFYYHEIAGFEVIDRKHGSLGNVSSVLEYPNNPLLQVQQGHKEILVPVRDEVILCVDRNTKTIEVEMPEGLVDIYLADDHSDDMDL